jgi:hypothetical protein
MISFHGDHIDDCPLLLKLMFYELFVINVFAEC